MRFIGMLLLGGLAFNRLFIKYVFAQAFDLNEEGWRKLTWRWAIFALALAAPERDRLAEFFDGDLGGLQDCGDHALMFLFALAQTPLVLRHDNSAGE